MSRFIPVVLIAAAAAVLAVILFHRHSAERTADHRASATTTATRFAAAWTQGNDAAAAALTDRPASFQRALKANRAGLDGARATVRVARLEVAEGERSASALLDVHWEVPGFGTWRSSARATLRRVKDDWRLRMSPRLIDNRLRTTTRLGTTAEPASQAPILDREGRAIVRRRLVVQVGLERDKVEDLGASARALAAIVDVDAKVLRRQLAGAGQRQFVVATTLRPEDYAPLKDRLRTVPGLQTVQTTQPLAPSREFARALLGGLQQQFGAQLKSTPTRRIVIRDNATGEVVKTLKTLRGKRGRPLRTRLSQRAQGAAETALAGVDGAAALVAVQPSTGDVLAVANRPTDEGFDRALNGVYPPGSTFKVITTAALLRRGLDVDTVVPCPKTQLVDGRSFKNFEGEAGASPTYAADFAMSCNTALISLADRLHDGDLTTVAADFGLGRPTHTALDIARSRVPQPEGAVAHAAAMIGQDKITVTPLAMAGVAATVANGRWHAPRILDGDPRDAGPPLGDVQTLRRLMRGVVTGGTGTALATIPGEVIGKSGTAEFGSGDPPPTHAWFIAARDDLALAVIVEQGQSGSAVAAPVAARFFRAHD